MLSNLNKLADEKTAQLIADSPWMRAEDLSLAVKRVCEAPGTHRAKQFRLLKIADRFNAAIAPLAACRPRCAHCCHMPTMIYAHEAERLAAASGRKMAHPALKRFDIALFDSQKYYRQPCPFLRDSLCTVYEARPVICRLHHSLNTDADDCRVDVPQDQRKPIASYDVDLIELPYHKLMMTKRPPEVWAAIQDFFPD